MASIIKPKKSNTAGAIPSPSILGEGELASNIADGTLFLKQSNEEIAIFKNKQYIDKIAKKFAIILG